MKKIPILLIICLLLLVDYSAGQQKNTYSPSAKIESLQELLAADPTRIDLRLQLAKVYLQVEGYTLALDEYRQVLSTLKNIPNHIPQLTDSYYGLGLAYSGLEKFDMAIDAFNTALQYISDKAHIHAALGAAHANLHQYEKALKAYQTAHRLQPSDAMINHQLGNIYSKRGKRLEAIQHHQNAIKISPDLASAHYQLGLLYSQENRFEEAIEAFEAAYTKDPELIQALYNLSQTYLRSGNRIKAREKMQLFEKRKRTLKSIQDLRSALHRTQDIHEKARILTNIGRLYLNHKLYLKAITEYQKALGLDPKVVEAHNGIGIAYAMEERYADAITAQNNALKIKPNFAEAHAGLGLAYLMQNKPDSALKHYKQAITPDNNNPKLAQEVHLKIGLIMLNQDNYPKAILAYRAVINLNPNSIEAYHNLGLCYAHSKRVEDALSALYKAIEISQANSNGKSYQGEISSGQTSFLPETYYLIGELHSQQKKYHEAEVAYINSGLPKAYDALAQLKAKVASSYQDPKKRQEILKKAASFAHKAIRLNPDTAGFHNTLALIAFRQGDYNTAETSIRKALELNPNNRNYQEGLKHIQDSMSKE